jgi:CHAT domain-containing protein/uncharacterized tellurite resistance protein B-like protein
LAFAQERLGMRAFRFVLWVSLVAGLLMASALAWDRAGAQSGDDLLGLRRQIQQLEHAGRYAEAIPLAERYADAMKRQYGASHPIYAEAVRKQANLFQASQHFSEAEILYRRALEINEAALEPGHPAIATAVSNLANLLHVTNRSAEAEPLLRRLLTMAEKSFAPNDPTVAIVLKNLSEVLLATSQYREAESAMRRALSIEEDHYGRDHLEVAVTLNDLSALLSGTSRLGEAEALLRRALTIAEKNAGPDDAKVATFLGNLGTLLSRTNRLAEAESLLRRAVAIREKEFGPDHSEVRIALNNLATLLLLTNHAAEAEGLLRRSLAIAERDYGAEHPDVGVALMQLSMFLRSVNRFAEAEVLTRRAVRIAELKLAPDSNDLAFHLSSLGGLLLQIGRVLEAEPTLLRALAIEEKSANNRSQFVEILVNLAFIRAELGDWAGALAMHARAKPILLARDGWDAGNRMGVTRAVLIDNTSFFRAHARAAYRADRASIALREEGFELAQWVLLTSAQEALAQMAVRFAAGAGPLANLVREQQDLVGRRKSDDRRLLAALGEGNAKVAGDARASIAAIDARLDALDARLADRFPGYAGLNQPKPLDIGSAQAALNDDEALAAFLHVPKYGNLPEEAFAWVVTRTDARWFKLSLTPSQIEEHVAALRCGLDNAAWQDHGAARCADLLKAKATTEVQPGQTLPFDLARAYDLYRALLGPVEDLIKGRHLLLVPSGPLTSLPFQVLVTAPPASAITSDAGAYGKAAWLIKRHALTVLPSVASLKALREFAKVSKATEPFIGFGNPLLLGPSGSDKRAWERQSCPSTSPQSIRVPGRTIPTASARFFRGNLANVELIRNQSPLPETADELCVVARSTGSSDTAVHLGGSATEARIKALSADGTLGNARIVHFATHGLLARETGMVMASNAEPALIFTPPQEPTDEDDGLLTASEVAQLKLDADWVVLSACNTAAGGSDGLNAEALSGLARAFFYAGARALLVSHWAVDSQATVSLVTKAFGEISADGKVGRAEALRRSMLALMATNERNAHPANWAPFVMVGAGDGHESPTTPAAPAQSKATVAAKKKNSGAKSLNRLDWRTEIWRQ